MPLVFSDYIHHALKNASYVTLEDGTIAGNIRECPGVFAFGKDEGECRERLQVILESWVLLGLKLGHPLPIIRGINLNEDPNYEQDYRS